MEAIEAVDFYREPYPSPHTLKHFSEKFQKQFLAKQLPRAAQSATPRQFVIKVIAQKQAYIQAELLEDFRVYFFFPCIG